MSEQNMSPDVSPGSLKKAKTGVRRVNNMPLWIFGGVVMAFLLVLVMVAADRSSKQNAPAGQEEKFAAESSASFASQVVGDSGAGIIPAATTEEPGLIEQDEIVAKEASKPEPLLIARPENFDIPPLPEHESVDEEARRFQMAKMQMFEQAVQAKSTVSVSMPRSSASSPSSDGYDVAERLESLRQQMARRGNNPTEAYQQRLNQVRNAVGGGDTGGDGMMLLAANNAGQAGYEQFSNSSEGDRWALDSGVEKPRSPYEIRAGFVLPATLISGINSSLPGQIIAQVSQNVYDTATGRNLLVPQGSKLIGSYDSNVAYGQSRVLIGWQRITFPDGKVLDIGNMAGSDSSGFAGFNDKTNNHYFRVFGSAILMSSVTAGVSLSQDRGGFDSGDSQRASDAMSEALGQQLGQVTAEMIRKNLNIAPTLEIRPGYRFNVVVTKDMTFSKPYQSFDY